LFWVRYPKDGVRGGGVTRLHRSVMQCKTKKRPGAPGRFRNLEVA
jgi:hypothetical protein